MTPNECCRFLERICNLRSLPNFYRSWIVDSFSTVTTDEELRVLCETISSELQAVAAHPDYFTVV